MNKIRIKMEFIDYLDREELEIIKIIEQAGYSTEENTSLCGLSEKFVGFLKKKEKTIVICTDNARKREYHTNSERRYTDEFERTAIHIKKALRHETVHVAQECNEGKLLDITKKLSLNQAKIEALKGSTMISGDEAKEKQAYILEDRPKLLLKELKKYCL